MTRTSRRLSLVASAAVAVVALSGCGNSPVRSGAAATVGDTRIPISDLSGYVSRALADPQAQQQLGADKAAFERQSLARMINHVVLTVAAKSKGVFVSPGAVDNKFAEFEQQAGGRQQLEQQAAQNGIAKPDLERFVSDVVLNDALADKLTADVQVPQAQLDALYAQQAAQNDQVHTAHILVPTSQQAASILAQVKADPTAFAALAAKFSTDTSNKDKGGDLGFAGRGQFVKAFEDAVFGAKPGTYLIVKTEFGFHVVHVIERKTTTLAQALPNLRRAALQKERETRTTELLAQVSKGLGVKVNPRFGRWNAAMGSVDELTDNSVTSPAPGTVEQAPADELPQG
ncbi:MAG: peptidylprolyl isomerase [Actinobacteria bacterium]|nr:peptidylprolyl isomerase [Actinomycetota bacterium]MCA1721718.1 peptidylprolyl isomerase [Actinomycetota bacterium]